MDSKLQPLKNLPPQNPIINPNVRIPREEERCKATMSKLSDIVLATISTSKPISQELRSHIEQRLREFFPSLHTPTHPPYSSMIQEAIAELNEENGSSEEAISGYIKRDYENLPWGHASLLSHHLRKLCLNGEIVLMNKGRYAGGDLGIKEEMKQSNNKRQIRGGKIIEAFEEQSEVEKGQTEVTGQTKKALEEQKKGTPGKVEGLRIEVMKKLNKVKEERIQILQGRNGRGRQEIEVTEQHKEGPTMEPYDRKYLEDRQQKGIPCREVKSTYAVIEKETQLQQPEERTIGEQSRPQGQRIEVRTEVLGLCHPDEGEGKAVGESMRVSVGVSSILVMEEEKKESLKPEGQQQSKSPHRERKLICGLLAQQWSQQRIFCQPKAPKSRSGTMLVTLELHTDRVQQEQEQIGLSNPIRPPELEGTASDELMQKQNKPIKVYVRRRVRKSQPKESETLVDAQTNSQLEENQQLEFPESDKPIAFKLKTKEADTSGAQEAAISQPLTMRSSLGALLDLLKPKTEQQVEPENPSGPPKLFRQQKPLECEPIIRSLIVPIDSQESKLFQHQAPPNPERTLQPSLSTAEDTTVSSYLHTDLEHVVQQPELQKRGVSLDFEGSLVEAEVTTYIDIPVSSELKVTAMEHLSEKQKQQAKLHGEAEANESMANNCFN